MKREPREIAVIAEMAVFLFAAMLTVAPVAAQQVTGTLGEPSATTTINGKQIPAPPPPFGGSNVGSLRDFERFLRACALRSANLLNKADLARDVGIAPSTANQWLSMQEASGQAVMLEPWFSNRTKSIVKRPKLYIADTGLLCALLNIRSEEALRQSPAAGAVWETFIFAQLRDRERRAGRTSSLFFWRDRTREVDFVVDAGGRLELFEAKWTELPDLGDTVNLDFVRNVIGKSRVTGGGVISRTPNSFPFPNGFRALPVTELG
jgi:uncharacterized protein